MLSRDPVTLGSDLENLTHRLLKKFYTIVSFSSENPQVDIPWYHCGVWVWHCLRCFALTHWGPLYNFIPPSPLGNDTAPMSHDVSGRCSEQTRRNLLWDGRYYSQNVRALKYLYPVLISLPLQKCHMWQHFIPVSSAARIYFLRHPEYIFGAVRDYLDPRE